MGNINFRLDDDLEKRMRLRAGEVKYRTPSIYLRELVEADLEKADREKARAEKAKANG